jgi:amino acid transporter
MNTKNTPFNPLKPNLNSEYTYSRTLSYLDIFSAGYGFIVGAGIFTLLPFIIKYSGKRAWVAFIIGGIICILTGLSYSKLNSIFPTNDGEYAWILNIMNFDKDRNPDKLNKGIKWASNIIVWIIFFIGILSGATIVASQAYFVKDYIDFNKHLLIAILLAVPTLINIVGTKYTSIFNKTMMGVITSLFAVVFGLASFKGNLSEKLSNMPSTNNFQGTFVASFITIFLYNGFQSIIHLSEEAQDENDIPKGIMGTLIFGIFLYICFTLSVISLIGIKQGSQSKMPMIDALNTFFSSKTTNIVYLITIIALTNTLVIITLSRSRLLQKLSVRGLAPSLFKKISYKENFSNNLKVKTPINAIVAVAIITYLFTFIKKGSVEFLAQLTNISLFLIFIIVNLLVIIFYYKEKTVDEEKRNLKIKLLSGYPWYAILGAILTIIYLLNIGKLKYPPK